MQRRQAGQRNHLAAAVANVNLADILGQHAERRIQLGDDALHAVAVHEIVDVSRTERGGERRVQVRQRNAQRARLGLINVHFELRRVLQSLETQLDDVGIFRGESQQLVARLHELVMARPA